MPPGSPYRSRVPRRSRTPRHSGIPPRTGTPQRSVIPQRVETQPRTETPPHTVTPPRTATPPRTETPPRPGKAVDSGISGRESNGCERRVRSRPARCSVSTRWSVWGVPCTVRRAHPETRRPRGHDGSVGLRRGGGTGPFRPAGPAPPATRRLCLRRRDALVVDRPVRLGLRPGLARPGALHHRRAGPGLPRTPGLIHKPDGKLPYTPPIPLYLAVCRVTGTTPSWSRPISA